MGLTLEGPGDGHERGAHGKVLTVDRRAGRDHAAPEEEANAEVYRGGPTPEARIRDFEPMESRGKKSSRDGALHVQRRLGAGAFGVVYQALDRERGRWWP